MAKSKANTRFYANAYPDYRAGNSENIYFDNNEPKLSPEFSSNMDKAIAELLTYLDSDTSKVLSYGDKIYTGSAGIAMLYLLKHKSSRSLLKSRAILEAKADVLKFADQQSRIKDRISFLNGDVGILALAAVLHFLDGNQSRATICARKMLLYSKFATSADSSVPDELLYGRAGYLHALLFVRKYLPNELVPDSVASEVVNAIITSGRRSSSSRRTSSRVPPLHFEWHDKEYVGAAHGYCGILSTLLLAYKQNLISAADINYFVKPTIDYVLEMQYPSKNIPSSVGSRNYDALVQWCHGAPGAIHMVALAHEVFGEEKYLKAAIEFGEVTWERGLLTKGYSLCHGVSGNGYTFLKLYQMTKDTKHLHRATKFAEWCFTYGTRQDFEPDRPFSLFEGVSGVLYFLVDLLQPCDTRFPGVEL